MMQAIFDLINEVTGWQTESVGVEHYARVVRRRMVVQGIQDVELYQARLRGDARERAALVEEIVVTETWFLRNPELFAWLRAHLTALRQRRFGPVRMVSAPCSTGEEAYTLVITALEAGYAPQDVKVLGLDLSASAIHRARRASYREASFRGTSPAFRGAWFHATADTWTLREDVRRLASFGVENLTSPAASSHIERSDIILCRNLLIYLDADAIRRVLTHLSQSLVPGGILALGASDLSPDLPSGLERLSLPGCGIVLRAVAPSAAGERPAHAPAHPRRPRVHHRPARPVAGPPTPVEVAPPPAEELAERLRALRALADAGRLSEAQALCEPLLQAEAPAAEVFYLGAVIADGLDDPGRARDLLRRALYVDPDHAESLSFLAAMAKAHNAPEEARRLWRRAQVSEARQVRSP